MEQLVFRFENGDESVVSLLYGNGFDVMKSILRKVDYMLMVKFVECYNYYQLTGKYMPKGF